MVFRLKMSTLIISNTDETHNSVVPIDKYELKKMADFIYKYLENN